MKPFVLRGEFVTIGIYCIENTVDGKKYIGRSINVERRWKEHKSYLTREVSGKRTNRYLYAAVCKYCIDAFKFYTLEEFGAIDHKLLSERELFWITTHKSHCRGFGYNLRLDSPEGMIVSEETRKKISDAKRGVPLKQEHKDKIGLGNTGKIISATTRTKMSEAQKGRPISDATRERMSRSHIGVPLSEDHSRNIGVANTGRVVSEATKNKLRESNVGKTRSEEAKKNMSIAHTGVPLSEQHKKSLSIAKKGYVPHNKAGELLSELRRGKPISEETRKKMSDSAYKREALKRAQKDS